MATKRKLSSAKIERQMALDTNSSGYSSKLSDVEVTVPQEDTGEASEKDDQQPGNQMGTSARKMQGCPLPVLSTKIWQPPL